MTTIVDQLQTESRSNAFMTQQSAGQSRGGSRDAQAVSNLNGKRAGQQQTTEVKIREMCHLVREQAFEKLESNIVVHVLQQIIRSLRSKENQREQIFKQLLGRTGVLKVYAMFNNSTVAEIRKLSGRLLIEALYMSSLNQDFLCELLDFEPLNGRVCLNSDLPPLIRQKIQTNASFLATIHNLAEAQPINQEKRYWSFPEFKEITSVLPQSATDSMFNTISSNKEKDSAAEFSNFPDSSLYMIGFKFKQQSTTQQTKKDQVGLKLFTRETEELPKPSLVEQVAQQSKAQNEVFKTSTSNPDFVLNSNPSERREDKPRQKSVTQSQKQSLPLFLQKSIQKIHTITHQFKTTTESTESQNRNGTTGTSGNDSGSQKSYMRHTSNSEKRKRSRSNTLKIKSSLVNKNRQKPGNLPIKQLTSTYPHTANETSDRSYSPLPQSAPVILPQESPPRNPADMTKLIKLLNKPEMLLLSHLQNQIKYYYPQRMNKHLQITQQSSPQKAANFMETVEKQRRIINDQALSARSKYSQQQTQPQNHTMTKPRLSVGRDPKIPQGTVSVVTNRETPKRDSLVYSSLSIQNSHVINTIKPKKSKLHSDYPTNIKKTSPSSQVYTQVEPRSQTRHKTSSQGVDSMESQTLLQMRDSFEVSNDSIPIVSAATNPQTTQNTFTTFF